MRGYSIDKEDYLLRLRKIEGQVRGLQRMIDDDTYCIEIKEHPEVGVCFRCVKDLAKRKRAIERATRHAPPGPWWRRLHYRAGFNRC